MREYDLIIVGAGPAGSAAALFAAQRGMRCVLLDKAAFPRDKICGDALSGKSVRMLRELGLLERVRELPGTPIHRVVFTSPDGSVLDVNLRRHALTDPQSGNAYPMEGMVLPRRTLDEFLFSQAKAAADEIRTDCVVQELIRADQRPLCSARSRAMNGARITGVRGTCVDGAPLEYHGRLVLGCDGFSSMVARQAGLYQHRHRHCMVAARQYVRGVDGLTDQIELHFTDDLAPGYCWIFPAGDDLANVGLGLDCVDQRKRAVNPLKALQLMMTTTQFRHRFRQARAVGRAAGGYLPVGSVRRQCHGHGVLLLGDAAGLVDPFTGEGVGNALVSAKLAVDTAAEAIAADDFSAEFLQQYGERLWNQLGGEFRTSARLHRLSRCRPLFNWLVRRVGRSQELRDLIGAMMAGTESREQLLRPGFYARLLRK